jgi:hypothetical protein
VFDLTEQDFLNISNITGRIFENGVHRSDGCLSSVLCPNCEFLKQDLKGKHSWLNASSANDLSERVRVLGIRWQFQDADRAIPKFYVAKPNFMPKAGSPELERFIQATEQKLLDAFQSSTTRKLKTLPRPLFRALLELRKEKAIVIKPADKNLGLTVLDLEHYISLCFAHLEDATTYRPLIGAVAAT